MSTQTTKKLLKYESTYRSSRFNSAANTQSNGMTEYADSTDSTPIINYTSHIRANTKSHFQDDQKSTAQLNLTFNRFSPVIKGGWVTYRRKYLEGPVIGKGSFGVVKALFPVVDLIALQQMLPVRDQVPANRLGQGIRKLSDNRYEFFGIPLPPPTRAVKIMQMKSNQRSSDIKDALHVLREITIGAWLDHPNLVKISEIYTNKSNDISEVSNEVFHQPALMSEIPTDFTKVYLVMEYCSGGDLTTRSIPDDNKEETVSKMFVHVFRALSYINTMGIAHRDVKPENFLWSTRAANADVKLTDFGLANSPLHTLTTRAGTAYYVAPEIVQYAPQQHYSVACDSWSAGIMLHLFLLGFYPFQGENDVKTLLKVANDEIKWDDVRYDKISADAYDLLRKLLVKDPRRRISTTEALKHPWLRRATFEVTAIPMTVEEATGIVEALTAFYRCPVLKQLALCLMVRQMQDAEIARSRKKYMYLSLFCESEHFWVNINTVEKWLMCARERPCNDKGKPSCKVSCYMYPECIPELNCGIVEGKDSHNLPRRRVSLRQSMLWKSVSRLNDVLSNFSDHKLSISFTEFVAAQMMEELVHRSDLILDTFAGLRSEIPGRRSILIDARDLKRLLNPIYRCSTLDLEDVLRQTELIALCTYLGNLATDEESKTRVFHLLKHTIDPKSGTKHMKLTIDEFFVMMKSSNTVKTVEDTLKEGHHRPCDGYEAVKRRLILNKLQEIDEHCTNRKRKRRVLRG